MTEKAERGEPVTLTMKMPFLKISNKRMKMEKRVIENAVFEDMKREDENWGGGNSQ